MARMICVVVFALLVFPGMTKQQGSNAEMDRLMDELLRPYNKHVMPSKAVEVRFNIEVISTGLDDVKEVFSYVAWEKTSWNEPRLRWDPAEYGNITKILFPRNSLWLPDITLYQEIQKPELIYDAMAHNSYNGDVRTVVPVKRWSNCGVASFNINLVTCSLKYGSWGRDGLQLSLTTTDNPTLDNYFQPTRGWKAISLTGTKNVKRYPCCPEPYHDLQYAVQLQKISRATDWPMSTQEPPNELDSTESQEYMHVTASPQMEPGQTTNNSPTDKLKHITTDGKSSASNARMSMFTVLSSSIGLVYMYLQYLG